MRLVVWRTISKRHCVIEQAELGYELTDLSINGVFLGNGNDYIVATDYPVRF